MTQNTQRQHRQRSAAQVQTQIQTHRHGVGEFAVVSTLRCRFLAARAPMAVQLSGAARRLNMRSSMLNEQAVVRTAQHTSLLVPGSQSPQGCPAVRCCKEAGQEEQHAEQTGCRARSTAAAKPICARIGHHPVWTGHWRMHLSLTPVCDEKCLALGLMGWHRRAAVRTVRARMSHLDVNSLVGPVHLIQQLHSCHRNWWVFST